MPLSVHDFVSHMRPTGLGFGMASTEETCKALRSLADAIEAKELYVQGAKVFGVATADDFTITTLRLSFAECVKETGEVKALHAPDSQFPVAVAKT